jgi:urease accessory protein
MEEHASQHIQVFMEKNSSFSFVPHPVVPHENSKFYSSNEFHLSDQCSFMFGEIITCGRKHSGEAFKYAHFQNMTRVYYNERLILKDNVLLMPSLMPLDSMGLLEGYTHQGSFVFINTCGISLGEITDHLQNQMESMKDVEAGISLIQTGGFVIRILGNGGEQLFNFFQKVQAFIWDSKILLN